jgi:hypothetical protein
MKRILVAGAALTLGGCAADTAAHRAIPSHGEVQQVVAFSGSRPGGARTLLIFSTEGSGAPAVKDPPIAEYKPGVPIHRVVQNADGKPLFAYDLDISKNEGGAYRIAVRPAADGPTFKSTREVTVNRDQEAVRVDLLEQPQTGRKVSDWVSVVTAHDEQQSLPRHLVELHNRIFRWMHGE